MGLRSIQYGSFYDGVPQSILRAFWGRFEGSGYLSSNPCESMRTWSEMRLAVGTKTVQKTLPSFCLKAVQYCQLMGYDFQITVQILEG